MQSDFAASHSILFWYQLCFGMYSTLNEVQHCSECTDGFRIILAIRLLSASNIMRLNDAYFQENKSIIAFLQQCALHSQDFAVCNREYIGFQNPDRCGSALSPDYVRKNSSMFNAIFRVQNFSGQL